jgi:hypothetical protein
MRLKIDAGVDVLGGHVMSYDGGAQIPSALSRRLDIIQRRIIFPAQLLQFLGLFAKLRNAWNNLAATGQFFLMKGEI